MGKIKALVFGLMGLGLMSWGFYRFFNPPPGVQLGWVNRWDMPVILWILAVGYFFFFMVYSIKK